MSIAKKQDWVACAHKVPSEACVKCHPELSASFKAKKDWCTEHEVPESQCLACHPDLDFSPPKEPPPAADVAFIVHEGENVEALEPHRVAGKFTIFDFRADWCPPCRKADEHLFAKLATRQDIAIRKLNVVSWESPLAEHWLREVPELPYLVIYNPAGVKVAAISGADFEAIDSALEPSP